MSQISEHNVDVEIQKTLSSINDITLKIKKELTAINDLVRENGRLNVAVENGNGKLLKVAREMEIDVPVGTENEEEVQNFAIPITADYITEKLMAAIHTNDDTW